MAITDELREYTEEQIKWLDMTKVHYRKLFAIADRIDSECERQLEALYHDMSDAEYIELPKDADGEVIHVGDVMEWVDEPGNTFEVIGVGDGTLFYANDLGFSDWTRAGNKRHHKQPTIEDVLREMADRCYADEDEPRDRDAIVAEYAAKLRLAGEDE